MQSGSKSGAEAVSLYRWEKAGKDAAAARAEDQIAAEVAIAFSYNRLSHVVMMATPADLADFALGFSLTEGILRDKNELLGVELIPRDQGIELAMTVSPECFARLNKQRRNLTGRTGCGLCGAESLQQAMRYPPPVSGNIRLSHLAIQHAVTELNDQQALQKITGAVHAAAWCSLSGEIKLLREDVGRHNALDKLIGCLHQQEFNPQSGFVLVSSRASYEMVYKTAAAGIELIAAVSAPTKLAVDFALQAGVTLVGFSRPGRHNIYTFPGRIVDER